MDILQSAFDEEFIRMAKEDASEQELELLLDSIPESIENILSNLPKDLLVRIKKQAPEKLEKDRKFHDEFVIRNYNRWKTAFDLLDLEIAVAMEAGDELNRRIRPDVSKNNDLLFDVLVRLQARGCLISQEISSLLKNGYPDGAHARWRALHEVNVISKFIAKNGTEAAKRYNDYEFVESFKGANQLNKHESKLNAKGFTEKEICDFENWYRQAKDKYGKDFKNPYGWANIFLQKNRVFFSDLEKEVGLEHWRPYYKWASQNIHTTVNSLRNMLGLSESKEDVLLVGPSNSGMSEPGHSTAISLMQITITLLTQRVNIDSVIFMKILSSLSKEIGNEFLQVDKNLNQE